MRPLDETAVPPRSRARPPIAVMGPVLPAVEAAVLERGILHRSPVAKAAARLQAQSDAVAMMRELVPSPWDLDVFIDQLAEHRGRKIMVIVRVMPEDLTGVWMRTLAADYIFVTATTDPALHLSIIAHEIAHMILGHQSKSLKSMAAKLRFVNATRQVEEAKEYDAEMVATEFVSGLRLSHSSIDWRPRPELRTDVYRDGELSA